ncbi:hypothetical protein [Paenibacillus sp. MMS18-CY102]|uniref:hypothetical protein n=1 Tax=Paenibacillus sp. MMS18-CY102 TaxID=2682849 RepID=UPI00136641DF|nr:hypothetical protein [Paenibacillus sp. MMS18-CY102]MWC30465.1 hypothetical protein [Paenibacillus sp. MMS18-CY102]
MGKRLKRWKSWKWPIGATGFIVLLLGVHAVKSSPEFAEAQGAESGSKAAVSNNLPTSRQQGADAWMEQRENGNRMEGRPSFGRRGAGRSSSSADNQDNQNGNFPDRENPSFGSNSRVS